uniref:Uncharacterized protein n=1 Tax=Strongyloides venezuelensis TaxID=75913 RepID=A0A0K0G669_STRVS
MLELSNFGHAFNISYDCSITSTFYNILPSKHKLKVLICLDKKSGCYNTPFKKSFRDDLTIVPASQNTNSFYYNVFQDQICQLELPEAFSFY